MTEALFVHVVMPVGSDKSGKAKKAAITRGAKLAHIEVRFPDYTPLQEAPWLERLIDQMRRAAVVIADLSLERPSCYYELGIAEALGKRVVLLARQGTPIHQTAGRSEVRFYELNDEITRIIASALQNS